MKNIFKKSFVFGLFFVSSFMKAAFSSEAAQIATSFAREQQVSHPLRPCWFGNTLTFFVTQSFLFHDGVGYKSARNYDGKADFERFFESLVDMCNNILHRGIVLPENAVSYGSDRKMVELRGELVVNEQGSDVYRFICSKYAGTGVLVVDLNNMHSQEGLGSVSMRDLLVRILPRHERYNFKRIHDVEFALQDITSNPVVRYRVVAERNNPQQLHD